MTVREQAEGWYVGRPGCKERYRQWSVYALDPGENPAAGKRSQEWIAVGQTELDCVQDMALVLRCAEGWAVAEAAKLYNGGPTSDS